MFSLPLHLLSLFANLLNSWDVTGKPIIVEYPKLFYRKRLEVAFNVESIVQL